MTQHVMSYRTTNVRVHERIHASKQACKTLTHACVWVCVGMVAGVYFCACLPVVGSLWGVFWGKGGGGGPVLESKGPKKHCQKNTAS